MAYPASYHEFIKLFNAGHFFEAHEVLEGAWHQSRRQNDFYRGLIQIAASLVHVQKRNSSGARELFRTSRKHLDPFLPCHEGLNLERLLAEIEHLDQLLACGRDTNWEKIPFPALALEKEN